MLAFGIISTAANPCLRVGVRLNQQVIDLAGLFDHLEVIPKADLNLFLSPTLNRYIAKGKEYHLWIKQQILSVLVDTNEITQEFIYDLEQVFIYMPLDCRGFTDFYTSKQHAVNIGKLFRPDNPLLPNWVHMPIGYNGRASSIVVSGHPVKHPHGQIKSGDHIEVTASKKLDFEVELGVVIGKDSCLGEAIQIGDADNYIFGVCLLNDWSARDIQAWEYQPLGPFTSKSFLTSISSFIIPIEELDTFKVSIPVQDPRPAEYLIDPDPYLYDLEFQVSLKPSASSTEYLISKTNFKDIYWTIRQWIAHHTISGCNLQVGDILASGTISGNLTENSGSLMELAVNGSAPIVLANGEKRSFLADGDELIIRGFAGQKLFIGEVSGVISA